MARATESANDDGIVTNSRWWGVASIVAYGVANWDYFSRSPHTVNEGWWEADTPEGGADKLGHAYTAHVLTHAMTAYYEHHGQSLASAANEAAWTSLLLTGAMELGDSFSDYGYSHQDMLMNAAGVYIGYQTVVDDRWRDRIDFRVEHSLRSSSRDPFTDYEQLKYVLVLKLGGFALFRDSPLRWLELQGGYYARGFDDDAVRNERTTYFGIGLNLSAWFREQGWSRTATVLRFVQPPDSYVAEVHQRHDR